MLEAFRAWLERPYREDMSAVHWFLFYGLLLAIAAIWGLILRSFREV